MKPLIDLFIKFLQPPASKNIPVLLPNYSYRGLHLLP